MIATSSGLPRKSSVIFGNLRKFSENVRQRSCDLRTNLGECYRGYYTVARGYEFYVLVARTISHSLAALTREILFLPLEHRIHIFSPPCNIPYLFAKGEVNIGEYSPMFTEPQANNCFSIIFRGDYKKTD